jgi:transcriptional regulator with XRE-family HTH domain
MSQAQFWASIGITQSGGSRYERGRVMSKQVQYLLHLAYALDEDAAELFDRLITGLHANEGREK